MSIPRRRKKNKEFLQEIVEPSVQYQDEAEEEAVVEPVENVAAPKVNWDELNERQREEIIQIERLKDARSEKRPI